MKKILFVRGEKPRYLAKGNYNVLRLKYIAQMFPDAKFVICFRNPLQQCRSLERVHRRFKELSNDSKSFDKELRAMGHFEFGNSRKPIKINQSDFDDTLNYWDAGDDYSGYLAQWISVYGTVLDDYLVGGQHQRGGKDVGKLPARLEREAKRGSIPCRCAGSVARMASTGQKTGYFGGLEQGVRTCFKR